MLVIKKLTEELLPTLQDTAVLDALLPDGLAGVCGNGRAVFVLLLDGKAAGTLIMDSVPEGSSPAYLRVQNTVVLPELRRHGLGRMLMCMAAGEAVGRKVWFLGCSPHLSADAQAFAEAMHFRAGYAPDALLLDLSDVEGLRHG